MRVILILYILSGTANADRTEEIAWQAAAIATLIADADQTRRIVADCREANPVLGRCGEKLDYRIYFASVAALHTAGAVVLPRKVRRIWQAALMITQSFQIGRNHQGGYKLAVIGRWAW